MFPASKPTDTPSPQRVFLGWDRPALPTIADHLITRFGNDFDDAWVVVPTARAGRLLEAHLLERRPVLVPPRIVTPGPFVDAWAATVLPSRTVQIANALETGIAWVSVLRDFAGANDLSQAHQNAGHTRLAALVPAPPKPDDWAGWWSLAQRFVRTREQLASGLATFADAAEVATGSQLRWNILTALDDAYEATLTQWNRLDRESLRRRALSERDAHRFSSPVILAAFADQTPLQQRVLQHCNELTSYVFADASQAHLFNELGGLHTERWHQTPHVLPADCLRVVDRRGEEAEAAAHAIADAAEAWQQRTGDQLQEHRVAIALADEAHGPAIVRGIRTAGGSARTAAGRPLSESAPATLLQSLARLLRTRRLDALAEWVRHPDAEAYLTLRLGDRGLDLPWPTLLDGWATKTLRAELLSEWLETPEAADDGQAMTGATASRSEAIALVYRTAHALLPAFEDERQPLSAWSEPIREALRQVYQDRTLDAQRPGDADRLQALEVLADLLDQQADLSYQPESDPSLDAPAAIQWTLARLTGQRMSDHATAGDIEAMGLLDAALDDAPVLVLTGANDGNLPGQASDASDGLLTDGLRTQLGIPNNKARYARDAYLLEAIRRPRAACFMVAARRGDDDEPLKPSRLWVRGSDAEDTAVRLLRFYGRSVPGKADDTLPSNPPTWLRGGNANRFIIPRPDPTVPLPEKLGVTALRTYLSCPYRFYLAHILRLRASSDDANELDPPTFGSLIHDALAAFGKSSAEVREGTDELLLAEQLIGHFQRLTARAFGHEPRPAVRVQLAFAEERLTAFARLQAQWNRDGWTIARVEHPAAATFTVAGGSMCLEGRIDRIDIHPEFGVRIIDFKTGDTPKTPGKQHAREADGDRVWFDLQLPIYRELIQRDETLSDFQGQPIELGYTVLPRKPEETGWLPLDRNDAFWREANAMRDRVLDCILQRDFRPAVETPAYPDAFSRLCADDWAGRNEDLERWPKLPEVAERA
ncbi:MAG: PD-(D/E)XK nuclease family protein [Planctomycetota bacterium]